MHYVPCSATALLTPGFAQTRKAGLIAAVLSLIYGCSGVKKKNVQINPGTMKVRGQAPMV